MPTQLQPGQHCPLGNWFIGKQLIVGSAQFRMEFSLEQWHESIKRAYHDAVKSNQPGNIY